METLIKVFGKVSKPVFNPSKSHEETLNFVTDFREKKFSIIWRIENIHRCTLKTREFLESPSFSTGSSTAIKWTLRLYPEGRDLSENLAFRRMAMDFFAPSEIALPWGSSPITVNRATSRPDDADKNVQYSGLFIKRITTDPVTSSFKYRFVCETELLSNAIENKITYLFPKEGTADIPIDSTESSESGMTSGFRATDPSEYGTDYMIRTKDLKAPQTLVVRCSIYVTDAYNMNDSSNNVPGSTKCGSLLQDLKSVYESGKFADVTVQAGDVSFPAHKVILASRSRVFDAMFKHNMKECQTNIIHIENIEPLNLKNMLQYMYTGSVDDFNVEKAMSLYPVADKYFLGELKQWCVDIMLANLKVENVCQIAVLENFHPDPELKEATFNMFRNYTSEIFKRKEWRELVRDSDLRVLVSDILQVVSADFTTNCSDTK